MRCRLIAHLDAVLRFGHAPDWLQHIKPMHFRGLCVVNSKIVWVSGTRYL